MRRQQAKRVDALMQRGIDERYFESACLLVSRHNQPVFFRPYGSAQLDSVFDVASLTKPLATTAVVMQLCAQGVIRIDDSVGRWLPDAVKSFWGETPLWQLLSHCSGLPAWQPFFETVSNRQPGRARLYVKRQVFRQRSAYDAVSRNLYSDLGFMLLGWIVESATGTRLDQLAHRLLYSPLGLTHTGFATSDTALRARCHVVATERLRGVGRLRGVVHDDNCRSMGGVCGHAGLFSSAYDLHRLAGELVAAYRGGPRTIFDNDVVKCFFNARPVADSSWALGWDRPSGERPSCGTVFNANGVGHLGFTGTSLWIDLEASTWVILLTNRVFYGHDNQALRRFRPKIHNTVMRALRASYS